MAVFFFTVLPAAFAESSHEVLAKIPVQHNGRIKPFESFAQESVLTLTGKNHFQGISPARLVWDWIARPQKWAAEPMIPVTLPALQEEFSLMLIRGRVSPETLLHHHAFIEKTQQAIMRKEQKEKLSLEAQKRIEIYDRALLFQEIANGNLPGWIAHPEDPKAAWLPLKAFASEEGGKLLAQFFSPAKAAEVSENFQKLIALLAKDDAPQELFEAASNYALSLENLFESHGIILDQDTLKRELLYNRLRPFQWAWKFYLLSALFLTGLLIFGRKAPASLAFQGSTLNPSVAASGLFFLAGFAVHLYGFFLRCLIAGRPPVTNMYESVIWVSWGVVLFSLILFGVYRALFIPVTAACVASLALIIAEGFPVVLDGSLAPLVPVLRSNFWLTIHVLTITLSYAAFALAWGLGHGVVFSFVFGRDQVQAQRLSQFLYRALQIGVILLASGTVLGGVWANYSWGRFWGWDPKETWALIALLGYLLVLHGRFTGWIGSFGIAVGSVVAFLGVLMAWYGVNFVLAAGLHSYGFGGGGTSYVFAVAAADLLLIGVAAWVYKQKQKTGTSTLSNLNLAVGNKGRYLERF